MLRIRRYRIFLVVAVFVIVVLYHFTSIRDWEDTTSGSVQGLIRHGRKTATPSPQAAAGIPVVEQQPTTLADSPAVSTISAAAEPSHETAIAIETAKVLDPPQDSSATGPSRTETNRTPLPEPGSVRPPPDPQISPSPTHDHADDNSQGRLDTATAPETSSKVHWTRLPELFPIPTKSLIKFPSGKPSPIPRIQHSFKDETSSARIDREKKLSTIKEAFKFSWNGYKQHAWLHDELRPSSGDFRDPFCGWAATLVDSLDTMWIMGLEEDFVEATNALNEIDFTTSNRGGIPVFETTIRYLGGLVSAYDLSEGKYKILLDKAVELADVLMGAFDTPNRMPITYYRWQPNFASQPQRASPRTVLAELGSLAVEFTRLAQITDEMRYYDAVARVTNELELFQNKTHIPGLWPKEVDASGCKRPLYQGTLPSAEPASNGPVPKALTHELGTGGNASLTIPIIPAASPIVEGPQISPTASPALPEILKEQSQKKSISAKKQGAAPTSQNLDPEGPAQRSGKGKRQLAMDSLNNIVSDSGSSTATANPTAEQPNTGGTKAGPAAPPQPSATQYVEECGEQGIESPPGAYKEKFSLGGMADSTYEYLPKQYMLLGGLVPQYRSMYEEAIEAANKYLLVRPMLPEDRDVLILGSAELASPVNSIEDLVVKPDQEHLLCFAGGMYAIGSKIFDRKEDMDIAAKLTDGCVWSYEATTTGVMPEGFKVIACANRDACEWNQTRWYAELDPYRSTREENERNSQQVRLNAQKNAEAAEAVRIKASQKDDTQTGSAQAHESDEPSGEVSAPAGSLTKRQTETVEDNKSLSGPKSTGDDDVSLPKNFGGSDEGPDGIVPARVPTMRENLLADTAETYPTHEEYVEERLKLEKLPIGVPEVSGRKYILRPEAIESVFIMYRITGDEIWREKGWKMFNAIENHTRVDYGYSAISDVLSDTPMALDEMESFWLAETLKYFYLLFSPPDLISLDEYVFNTEAHPFRRPV